jgi:MFS family permease
MGFATNYAFLMTGRFVAGIGLGFGFMIGPVYTAEVAPTATRGLLTTFPEVLFNIGTHIITDIYNNLVFSSFFHQDKLYVKGL